MSSMPRGSPPSAATRRGPGRFLVVALAAVVAIGVGYRALGPRSEPAPPAAPGPGEPPAAEAASPLSLPGLRGALVFSAFEPTGGTVAGQRLWSFDLRTGRLVPGPPVPDLQELLAVSSGPGWLVATRVRNGEGQAFVVRSFTEEAEAVPLAEGDLFALTPTAEELLVGRSTPIDGARPGCSGHRIELDLVDVASGRAQRLYRAELPCGDLLSLGSDGRRVLLSLRDRGRVGVYLMGTSGPRLLLADHALLSVSPVGGMLVTPSEGGPVRGLGVWPGTPTGPARYWGGSGHPVRLLPRGEELFVQRVVAWDRDGSEAIVTGIVGDRRGMWRVRTTVADRRSSTRISAPPHVDGPPPVRPALPGSELPANIGYSGAAFSVLLGPVFSSMPGSLFVLVDDGQAELSLPPGAPAPAGPLTWMP